MADRDVPPSLAPAPLIEILFVIDAVADSLDWPPGAAHLHRAAMGVCAVRAWRVCRSSSASTRTGPACVGAVAVWSRSRRDGALERDASSLKDVKCEVGTIPASAKA
jgi:hypothetical protein